MLVNPQGALFFSAMGTTVRPIPNSHPSVQAWKPSCLIRGAKYPSMAAVMRYWGILSPAVLQNPLRAGFCNKRLQKESLKNDLDAAPGSTVFAKMADKVQNDNIKPVASGKLLTIPTILTLGRLVAVPALVAVFYCRECWATGAGLIIFISACFTDWLDGYLARKMGSDSAFGAFLDPVADKLMVATTLVLLCARPPAVSLFTTLPWLLPVPAIAIIGREITMSAIREWAAAKGGDMYKAVAVNNIGKYKTALQMVALTLLLATNGRRYETQVQLAVAGVGLLYLATVLALWSIVVYAKSLWTALLE